MQQQAANGPAFRQIEALGSIDWALWQRAARQLEQALEGAADLSRRIHHLYLPVLFFCLAMHRRTTTRPVVIGIQAPQGSGKTTLVAHLLQLLPALGLRAAGVSIDDFYLTRTEQLALAARHPGNEFLEHRGYPGTHDVALGEATLAALRRLGPAPTAVEGAASAGETVRVPVYDKASHGGRGDRAPEADWRAVTGPLDVVFVEGWMLGFTPVPDARLQDPMLVPPNRALAAYDRWLRLIDAFVVLRAIDSSFVLRWRVQAEEDMAARGRPGLDRAAIEDYIRRFVPAYATWGGAPPQLPADRQLTIWLDGERRAVNFS